MALKLSQTIGLAGAALVLATAGCKKKSDESIQALGMPSVALESELVEVSERDMSYAPVFETEERYGTPVTEDDIDPIKGFHHETKGDLHVEGSGLDLIQKGTNRAVTLAIYAVDEDKNLLDPAQITPGARLVSLNMYPRNSYGIMDSYCLDENGNYKYDEKGEKKHATGPYQVTTPESGNGGFRYEVECWAKPGETVGVRYTYSQRLPYEHREIKIGERYFTYTDEDEAK